MSRVTQLSRAVSQAASRASPILDSTAPLMPKYADLLMREHHVHDRSITTTHRPTPQPSLANRRRPLMQTFSSSASSRQAAVSSLDATVIPSTSALYSSSSPVDQIRVPLLPDAFSITHPDASAVDAAISGSKPEVNTIVASDPDNVIPASGLAEVSHAGGADVVDLGFVHQGQPASEDAEPGMLSDLWKGLMDDIFHSPQAAPKKA